MVKIFALFLDMALLLDNINEIIAMNFLNVHKRLIFKDFTIAKFLLLRLEKEHKAKLLILQN